MPVRQLVRLVRPHHWVKNVIVLLPMVFAMRVHEVDRWAQAGLAALAFCLASSAVYVFNDIVDRHADTQHPRKKNRPLASADVGVATASVLAGALLVGGLLVAWRVNVLVCAVVAAYLAIQTVYSLWLKKRMLVDVICIALGFVLRAVAGAVAIGVAASPWLIICTFTLCMFMGFCKRRSEVRALPDQNQAVGYRPTLAGYAPELLTHLITLSAGIAVMSYLLYATSPITEERFGTIYLVYTLPLVIYAVFRFAMLSIFGRYDDPTELILRDRPFQVTAAIWVVTVLAAVYYGREIQAWINARPHY